MTTSVDSLYLVFWKEIVSLMVLNKTIQYLEIVPELTQNPISRILHPIKSKTPILLSLTATFL
jgi:hypothetical protein